MVEKAALQPEQKIASPVANWASSINVPKLTEIT
jgi:hypothetical protein